MESIGQDQVEEDIASYLGESFGGLLVYDMAAFKNASKATKDRVTESFDDARPILWLKPLEKHDIETPYVAYGNEATLHYAYGEICLVVEVEAAVDRRVYHE